MTVSTTLATAPLEKDPARANRAHRAAIEAAATNEAAALWTREREENRR
jgi:hypothetical protein